jgi:hypothetical protein
MYMIIGQNQQSSVVMYIWFNNWVMARIKVRMSNVTFNNTSAISLRSVLLLEETVHGEVYSVQHR